MKTEMCMYIFSQVIAECDALVPSGASDEERHEFTEWVVNRWRAHLHLDAERLARYLEEFRRCDEAEREIFLEALRADYNKRLQMTP